MTPRERWLAALQRRRPDQVPMDYRATPEATKRLMQYFGCATMPALYARLHIDRPVTIGPHYVGPPVAPNADAFGCRYTYVDYGTGSYRECTHHALAGYQSVEQIEREYTWPSPDWWDYSGIRRQAAGLEKYPVSGGGSEPFLTYTLLRGQEQAHLDLILHPEIVHYCLDRLFDLCYERTRRIYEQAPGTVLITGVSEDLGWQDGLLYSPAHIREFLLPRMTRMMNLVHEAGAFVLCHSDGAIREILLDLAEAGVDLLDPVQWRCKGMEREGLKRDFGDRIAFHGAVDSQFTLAFGSVSDVRQEVLDNLRILGDRGGYILGPCHNIQAITPPENVVAMYDMCYEHGRT